LDGSFRIVALMAFAADTSLPDTPDRIRREKVKIAIRRPDSACFGRSFHLAISPVDEGSHKRWQLGVCPVDAFATNDVAIPQTVWRVTVNVAAGG